eukprot:2864075-Prymnesium_polylepis.1
MLCMCAGPRRASASTAPRRRACMMTAYARVMAASIAAAPDSPSASGVSPSARRRSMSASNSEEPHE